MNHDLFLLIRNRICQFYCQHTYQLCSLYPVLRSVSYGKLPFWNSLTVFRWKVTVIYQKVAVLWESYHFRVKVTVFEPNSWNRVLGWISRRTFSFSFSISSLNPIYYFVSYNSCQKRNQSHFFLFEWQQVKIANFWSDAISSFNMLRSAGGFEGPEWVSGCFYLYVCFLRFDCPSSHSLLLDNCMFRLIFFWILNFNLYWTWLSKRMIYENGRAERQTRRTF